MTERARARRDTRDGRAARFAYYEARKLNNPPNSLLDYNDAKRGLAPPAERRARERRHATVPATRPGGDERSGIMTRTT